MFPLVVFVLVSYRLNPNVWFSPLMVFGTQWYILFNVVAGAASIPNELRLARQPRPDAGSSGSGFICRPCSPAS